MEQPLFEVTSRVTRESCRAQARARAGQHNHVVWLVNVMMALGVAVLWSIGSFHARWMTLLLVVLVAQTLLGVRLEGWRLYLGRNEAVPEVRQTFDAEGISVKTRVEESRIGYASVTGLFEDGRYVVVLLKHHTPLVLLKADVPDGRAAQLKQLLAERTGLAFRTLRT